MISMPELETMTRVYGEWAAIERDALKERFSAKVVQIKEHSQRWAEESVSEELLQTSCEALISDEMARDLAYYRERVSSALENYSRGTYSAGDVFGVVNELEAKLTGFRMFIAKLPEALGVTHLVRLDTRILVEQETVLRAGTKAVRKDDFKPMWSEAAYTLVPE